MHEVRDVALEVADMAFGAVDVERDVGDVARGIADVAGEVVDVARGVRNVVHDAADVARQVADVTFEVPDLAAAVADVPNRSAAALPRPRKRPPEGGLPFPTRVPAQAGSGALRAARLKRPPMSRRRSSRPCAPPDSLI